MQQLHTGATNATGARPAGSGTARELSCINTDANLLLYFRERHSEFRLKLPKACPIDIHFDKNMAVLDAALIDRIRGCLWGEILQASMIELQSPRDVATD